MEKRRENKGSKRVKKSDKDRWRDRYGISWRKSERDEIMRASETEGVREKERDAGKGGGIPRHTKKRNVFSM